MIAKIPETEYHLIKKRTPFDIMITIVLFFIVLVLKIGMSNSYRTEVLSLIMFYVWFFSCLIIRPKATFKILNQKHYYALLVFLMYMFIGSVFSFSLFTAIKGVGAFVQYLSPIFMYEFYSRFSDKKTNRVMIIFITGIYIYFSIKTILYLSINPLAAREMISTGIEETIMIGGGFSLSYGFAIIVPVLVYILSNVQNSWYTKIFYFLVITLFSIVVIKSQFATSFFLLLFGIGYVLAYKSKKRKGLLFFITILFVTLYLGQDYLIQPLTDFLQSKDSVLSNKILIVINLSQVSDIEHIGSMGERIMLTNSSLQTWFENLFFGIAYKYDFDGVRMMNAGLGNHAEWFDLLAKFGLISLFLFYYIFCPKKVYFNNINYKISIVLLLILGFLNPNHIFNIFFVTFFFAPLLNKGT